MIKTIIFLAFQLIFVISFGQIGRESRNNTVADCSGAINLIHLQTSKVQLSGGPGYLDELGQFSVYITEINSVWIKIEPRLNGKLIFELTPESNFDFEYYIFKDNTGDFCNKDFDFVKTEKLILSDSIQVYNEKQTQTSLKKLIGPVNCKVDDVFYLLLHSKEEHQKSVTLSFKAEGEFEKEEIKVQNCRKITTLKDLRIKIRDKETGDPIIANVTVEGLNMNDKLFQGTDFIFDAANGREKYIVINAEGYFFKKQLLKYYSTQNSEIIVELEKLAPGKKKSVEGLRFKSHTADFIPASYVALKRLLDFLILNKEVKIEIIGHVNAPGFKTEGKVNKLSVQRAKMAYEYLIENGVDKKRLIYSGKGNTEMVYPHPKTTIEEEANRRVEIKILAL